MLRLIPARPACGEDWACRRDRRDVRDRRDTYEGELELAINGHEGHLAHTEVTLGADSMLRRQRAALHARPMSKR